MQKRLQDQSPEAKATIKAIELFEKQSTLRVTIHDLTHRLWQFLPESRFSHTHPLCQLVKSTLLGSKCKIFEIDQFRSQAHLWKSGRIHRCHAGLVEVAVPIFHDHTLLFVLFGGPGRINSSLDLDYEFTQVKIASQFEKTHIEPHKKDLVLFSNETIEPIREALHQLGARLRCLYLDYHERYNQSSGPKAGTIDQFQRKELIHQFVFDTYQKKIRVKDLATLLCLSTERTRHVVVETTGKTLHQLVKEYRITASEALLLNTQKTIQQICDECGFAQPGRFSYYFKAKHGVSPQRWRYINQG
jgi:AraC-like DNA-binding protein